jgi:opacity protein-like surface antigen
MRLEGVYHNFGSPTYASPRLFALTSPAPIPAGTTFHGDNSLMAGIANLVWEFAAESGARLRPYALGGAGIYRVTTGESCTGNCGDFYEGKVKFNRIGFNIGAGLNFDVGATGMFLEARVHMVPKASRLQGESVSAQFVPISLGILFN